MEFCGIEPLHEQPEHTNRNIHQSICLCLAFDEGVVEGAGEDGGVVTGGFFVDLEFLLGIADEKGDHCDGIAGSVKLVWMIETG